MGLFRKKSSDAKDKEDMEDEVEEQERVKKVKKKKSSEDEEKRKRPPKPWGKRERILVLIVFALTVAISGVLAMSAREWKLPGIPRIKFNRIFSFSMPSFSGETIVVTGSSDLSIAKEKGKKVAYDFVNDTDNLSGVYGLYVIDLSTNESFGVNESEEYEPASLLKLPVMYTLLLQATKGQIDLNDTYTLTEKDKVSGSGILHTKQSGTKISYKDMLFFMGKYSDNTAYNIVRRNLGDALIQENINKLGMFNTSIKDYKTNPKDIGAFFHKVWDEGELNSEYKNELFDVLTNTNYEDHLKAGVPDVRVIHKYGRELHVVNDAGIVFSEKPYVVVIMSKGVVEDEADKIFPDLSRKIYESMSGM